MRAVRWLGKAREALSILWFFLTGGWVLALRPRFNAGTQGIANRLALMLVRYALFWAGVTALIWWLEPGLLVSSRAGLQTALQVLPATIVALLVLALGSLFVIAQSAIATWGTRSTVMLTVDAEAAAIVGRPLLLAIASLLLSGQVPDQGEPWPVVTAAVAALILASARLFIFIASLVVALLQRYTLPRGFPQYVVADLDRELEASALGLVVFRGPLLGEMARLSLQRGDSVAFLSTLEAIDDYAAQIIEASTEDSALSSFTTDDGHERENWLAKDVTSALVSVGERALYTAAPSEDTNATAKALGTLAVTFAAAGDEDSALIVVDGLTELGTSAHQVSPGVTNYFADPSLQLAYAERAGEEFGLAELAVRALAGWALCAAYPMYHFDGVEAHPLTGEGIKTFGDAPPWEAADQLLRSSAWEQTWANKQYLGPEPIAELLGRARAAHNSIHSDPE
jgi:hypothetical protein